jgi:inner membrane protein
MPTIMTHAVVGLGMARVFTAQPMPPLYWGLAATLSMLPDLDVVAFPLGIPYGALFGHRGFSHSLCCAALTGLVVALLTAERFHMNWWALWAFFFVVMGSHGILDAMTNGGLGIALLSPFDPTRYFFPWRPIQVSMIGFGFFSHWGLLALASEVLWVWVPTALVVGGVTAYRRFL